MAKRLRSPKHPVIGLKEAIERLKAFYDKEGRATVPRDAAVKVWGYTTTSGPALQIVATLIQYGLLDRIGGKNVKISELGTSVVEDDWEHLELCRDSGGKPLIVEAVSRRVWPVQGYRKGFVHEEVWLIIERHHKANGQPELRYFFSNMPQEMPTLEMVRE